MKQKMKLTIEIRSDDAAPVDVLAVLESLPKIIGETLDVDDIECDESTAYVEVGE